MEEKRKDLLEKRAKLISHVGECKLTEEIMKAQQLQACQEIVEVNRELNKPAAVPTPPEVVEPANPETITEPLAAV